MGNTPPARAANRPSLGAASLAGAALLIAIILAWQATALVRQDLAFTAVETEVSFWGRGSYQPDELTIARTGQRLDALLQAAPAHPAYQSLAASYWDWQVYWADNAEQEQLYAQRAQQARDIARQSRPAFVGNNRN